MDKEIRASQMQVGAALRPFCLLSGKDELTKGGWVRTWEKENCIRPKRLNSLKELVAI